MGKRRRSASSIQEDLPPKKPLTKDIVARIESWAQEAVDNYQLLLFDVEISPSWKIEVTIDNENGGEPGQGVTISQCVDVSRYIEALLDVDDDIPERYNIEVSSPGVERPLTKPKHFKHVVGREVKLVLHEPVEQQNVLEGTLVAFDDPRLQMDVDGKIYELTLSQLAKARLTYDFSGVEG